MVNCCTEVAGIEEGAITVSYCTGKTGGGATSEEFADNFMSSSLASAIFSSMARFSLQSVSKRISLPIRTGLAGMEAMVLCPSS